MSVSPTSCECPYSTAQYVLSFPCSNCPGIVDAVSGLLSGHGSKIGYYATTSNTDAMPLGSKFDHCLADVLYRWRIGVLPMDIITIVSNHSQSTDRHLGFGAPLLLSAHIARQQGRTGVAIARADRRGTLLNVQRTVALSF
jgi:formyltetrahydrofolate hydrolase